MTGGRRKTDWDFYQSDQSIDWDIKVDRDTGYDGMEGRVTSVRRRYFTITLPHALIIGLSACAGMVGGALLIGIFIGVKL